MTERHAPVDMSPEEFRRVGHALIDSLADFFMSLPKRKVTPSEGPAALRALLPSGALPTTGASAETLLRETVPLLTEHSLFNSHPSFFGYITAGGTPIGALADLVAACINPNVGAAALAPVATEIEKQTVRYIAELVGFPAGAGGVFGSGGAMANYVGFLAARRARAGAELRTEGLQARPRRLVLYASAETHTWIQKAADLFGLGTSAVRFISTDERQRMRTSELAAAIAHDRSRADTEPFLVVATAGSVSTGAVDPISEISALCRRERLWLHIDGAYGAFAASLADAEPDLKAIALADSLALDPHKWLYSPLEAGCTLVRDVRHLVDAFSFRPAYYHFAEHDEETNFYELGMQNSRGFRALKVWLALRQAGREGVIRMIADDIALSRALFAAVQTTPNLEARTQSLSITTFRYVPQNHTTLSRDELNTFNTHLLERVQASGEAYVSNAIVDGDFLLRACIVNFRTRLEHVVALPALVARLGRELERERA